MSLRYELLAAYRVSIEILLRVWSILILWHLLLATVWDRILQQDFCYYAVWPRPYLCNLFEELLPLKLVSLQYFFAVKQHYTNRRKTSVPNTQNKLFNEIICNFTSAQWFWSEPVSCGISVGSRSRCLWEIFVTEWAVEENELALL